MIEQSNVIGLAGRLEAMRHSLRCFFLNYMACKELKIN